MRPSRTLAAGLALLAASLLLVVLGASLRGPLNPACAGRPWAPDCLDARTGAGLAVMVLALPLALAGAVLVAMWMARREPEP